jgi:hypothetical protein
MQAVQALTVIPASRSPQHCEIVVLDNGRWHPNLEKLPGYTSKGFQSAGEVDEPFPYRPGFKWRRKIGGRHAKAVDKDNVTICFEISSSVAYPERPLFLAGDFAGGPFATCVSSVSLGGLEQAWLSQQLGDDDAKLRLSDMKGGRFTGLDIRAVGAHLRSLTPGFDGFRAGVARRGLGKAEVGHRQNRRQVHNLFEDFEDALSKVCPTDLEEAFRMLQQSQAFQAKFQQGLVYRFSQNDQVTQTLVKLYKTSLENKDVQQANYLLSLYSPFHSREITMQIFGCTEWACKRANWFHRLRTLPNPTKRERVQLFRKDTVEHMHAFGLRADNVERAAFSATKSECFFMKCNRNRLFHKYRQECESQRIKAMGKTAFYNWYTTRIFKQRKHELCCCTACINKGGVAFHTLRDLVKNVFGSTPLAFMYLDTFANLEHFFERDYRSILQESSDDSNICITFALSKANDENFRCPCNHEHTPKCKILQWDVSVLYALRNDITQHSKPEDLADNLWILDRAEDLLVQ